MEPQPKAVGSSILVQLTKILVMDCMKRGAGLKGDKGGPVQYGLVLPMCTGMSIALVLSSLKQSEPASAGEDSAEKPEKDIVLWSRIDQKSCFKAILSAGLKCIVVPTKMDGDMVITDMDAMRDNVEKYKGT